MKVMMKKYIVLKEIKRRNTEEPKYSGKSSSTSMIGDEEKREERLHFGKHLIDTRMSPLNYLPPV
jgi:hypothetical protein